MRQSFAALLELFRIKPFDRRVENEIYGRVFPHLEKERDCGYPFENDTELSRQTESLCAEQTLAKIERDIEAMPAAYGRAFRYILHRELSLHLAEFEDLARRRVQPKQIDPRLVATHA